MNTEEDDLQQEKLDQMNPQRVQRDNFLDVISQLESSGGTNLNHKPVIHGIQAGDTAMGQYGLMPNTVNELLNRQRLNNSRDPASVESSSDMKQQIENNPILEKQLANQLAQQVLTKNADPSMAAYAWHMGHNLTPQQIQDRDYQNNGYVQKFNKIRKQLGYK